MACPFQERVTVQGLMGGRSCPAALKSTWRHADDGNSGTRIGNQTERISFEPDGLGKVAPIVVDGGQPVEGLRMNQRAMSSIATRLARNAQVVLTEADSDRATSR